MKKRIGLLGGTFDPVHHGHIQLAQEAQETCALDRVLYIPASTPPHKLTAALTGYRERVEMLRLATARQQWGEVSLLEAGSAAPSYTIDTLNKLRSSLADEELFFIIGSDAFLEIHTWKNFHAVLAQTHFIVCTRGSCTSTTMQNYLHDLGFVLHDHIWQSNRHDGQIHFMATRLPDISSSAIRRRVMTGQSIDGLTPQEVVHYIQHHNLYG